MKCSNLYNSVKIETVEIKLNDLKSKINTKSNFWTVPDLIKCCDEVIGSVNKLLFPLYKRRALDEVKIGGKISLLEPASDLEGLNEEDIKFMIGEMEDKKDIPGWFDLTDNVIYKASETTLNRCIYSISILFFLLFGFVIVYIFDYFNLSNIITNSQTFYHSLRDLFVFYFFGTVGFLIHLFKLIGGKGSRITCIDSFLIWFSSRWISFMGMVSIFWLGFLLLVSSDKATIFNSILLGYSIDSFSEVILNRYGSLVSEGAKDVLCKSLFYS